MAQQLELDLDGTAMQSPVIKTSVGGKVYRLELQTPEEYADSTCSGCAFQPGNCFDVVESDACAMSFTTSSMVWRAEAPLFAFGCAKRINGEERCESYCGDKGTCVSS